MKIKNFMTLVSFALFLNVVHSYAMEFDTIERNLLRVSSYSIEGEEEILQEDPITGMTYPAKKTKFNQGNIIKTTFNDTWEVKREGTLSIVNAAYVIGLDASRPPTRTQIVEHFWFENADRRVQTYLAVEVNQSASTTKSIMQYRFLDPAYNVDPVVLRNWLSLTFQTYADYQGVVINNLHIQVHPEHFAVFFSLLAPEIEGGLQVSSAA